MRRIGRFTALILKAPWHLRWCAANMDVAHVALDLCAAQGAGLRLTER